MHKMHHFRWNNQKFAGEEAMPPPQQIFIADSRHILLPRPIPLRSLGFRNSRQEILKPPLGVQYGGYWCSGEVVFCFVWSVLYNCLLFVTYTSRPNVFASFCLLSCFAAHVADFRCGCICSCTILTSTSSSLLSGRSVRWPRRMLPSGKSRWVCAAHRNNIRKPKAQLPQRDRATHYVNKFVLCFSRYGS